LNKSQKSRGLLASKILFDDMPVKKQKGIEGLVLCRGRYIFINGKID